MQASAKVALATTSTLAARAGQFVAERGGNACDVAIAAALISATTEPGVCSLAGGGFVSVGSNPDDVVTIDGNVAVPGKDSLIAVQDGRVISVGMDYGGGTRTLVGPGSVAVPGTLAALESAWRHKGSLPWATLFEPSIAAAREGFPLSSACHYYLAYSAYPIFSASSDARDALLDSSGQLRAAGSNIIIPHLAATLEQIAREGADCFYTGSVAHTIVDWLGARGGTLTAADLADYRAIVRTPVKRQFEDWTITSNPPPAIGGAMLISMLAGIEMSTEGDDNARLLASMEAALRFRRRELDESDDLIEATRPLLTQSGATVHTSATDSEGLACSITLSAGYGSGEMPAGTGIALNNCLGEIDLNRRGLDARPIGRRLISNMAPSIAFCGDQTLAIGSPGASRITTALCQVLTQFVRQKLPLADAVAAPRAHVEIDDNAVARLFYEAGFAIPSDTTGYCYEQMNMYFGGVAAVLKSGEGFTVAADPRRVGGTYVTPSD